jgi:D-amino-acid oxidase
MTQSILERCKAIAPEILNENGEFEVLSVQVGLRPTRTRGARVEIEQVSGTEKSEGKFVCHNYGHHGAGYDFH